MDRRKSPPVRRRRWEIRLVLLGVLAFLLHEVPAGVIAAIQRVREGRLYLGSLDARESASQFAQPHLDGATGLPIAVGKSCTIRFVPRILQAHSVHNGTLRALCALGIVDASRLPNVIERLKRNGIPGQESFRPIPWPGEITLGDGCTLSFRQDGRFEYLGRTMFVAHTAAPPVALADLGDDVILFEAPRIVFVATHLGEEETTQRKAFFVVDLRTGLTFHRVDG